MFSMVRYKMVQVKLGQSYLNKKVYQTSQFWVWLHDLEPHLPIVFREIRMMPCKNYLWGKPVTWLSLDQTSSDYLRGLIWLNILDGFCWISFFRSLASPAAHGNAVMEGWRFLCPVPWIQNQWPVLWSFSAPTFSKNMPCINSELRKLGSSNNLPSMHRLKSFRKIHGPLGYKGFGFATAEGFGTRLVVKSISIEIYETDFSQRGSLQWPTIKTSLFQKNNNKKQGVLDTAEMVMNPMAENNKSPRKKNPISIILTKGRNIDRRTLPHFNLVSQCWRVAAVFIKTSQYAYASCTFIWPRRILRIQTPNPSPKQSPWKAMIAFFESTTVGLRHGLWAKFIWLFQTHTFLLYHLSGWKILFHQPGIFGFAKCSGHFERKKTRSRIPILFSIDLFWRFLLLQLFAKTCGKSPPPNNQKVDHREKMKKRWDGFPYSFETYLGIESEPQQGVVKQFALKTETVDLKTFETTQRLISELIAVPFARIPLNKAAAKFLPSL